MNSARRLRITEIVRKLEEIRDEVTSVYEDEDEAYNNLPEPLQWSKTGQAMNDAAQMISEAYGNIESALENLDDAMA